VRPDGTTPRDVCHTVYNSLQDAGLILRPEQTFKIDTAEYIDLSGNKTMQIRQSNISYDASLLFTHLVALTQQGSMLFVGQHGTGKTSSAVFVSSCLFGKSLSEVRKAVLYCNPETTFGDMIAITDFAALMHKGIERVVARPFVTSNVRIADEVNRMSAGKRAALYSIADSGIAVYRGVEIKAPPGPLFSTINPKDAGNDALELPFLDRYDICAKTRSVNSYLLKILAGRGVQDKRSEKVRKTLDSLPFLTEKDFLQVRKEIDLIPYDNDAMSRLSYFIAELNFCDRGGREVERKTKSDTEEKKPGPLCIDCHYLTEFNICNQTVQGLSSRGEMSAYLYPQVLAWWLGDKKVTWKHVELVLPYVMRHRVEPTTHAKNVDPIYYNDKHALISDLVEKSGKAYEQDLQKFPQLAEITDMIYRVNLYGNKSGVKRDDVMKMLKSSVKKIESGARAFIGVALNYAAKKLK
jgi:MoxR-like ATPase